MFTKCLRSVYEILQDTYSPRTSRFSVYEVLPKWLFCQFFLTFWLFTPFFSNFSISPFFSDWLISQFFTSKELQNTQNLPFPHSHRVKKTLSAEFYIKITLLRQLAKNIGKFALFFRYQIGKLTLFFRNQIGKFF